MTLWPTESHSEVAEAGVGIKAVHSLLAPPMYLLTPPIFAVRLVLLLLLPLPFLPYTPQCLGSSKATISCSM